MGVRDILVHPVKKLAFSLFRPEAAMLRAVLGGGLVVAACALGGCAPTPMPRLAATAPAPSVPAGSAAVPPDVSALAARYEDVRAGSTGRLDPAYRLAKADDPNDPVLPAALTILQQAQKNGLPIYKTILASPTLSPREMEQAAANGELTNFGKHPGSTFLGAIGEARVMQDFKAHAPLGLFLKMTPQPAKTKLPPGIVATGTDPDLLVTSTGFCLGVEGYFMLQVTVSFTDTIGPGTGGLVGTVPLGPSVVVSYWEVTTSTSYANILRRGQKVARWATALGGFTPPSTSCSGPLPPSVFVAVLGIDRGAYFSLAPADQTTLVTTVTSAGGFIMLFRDLTKDSIQHARNIDAQLQPIARP